MCGGRGGGGGGAGGGGGGGLRWLYRAQGRFRGCHGSPEGVEGGGGGGHFVPSAEQIWRQVLFPELPNQHQTQSNQDPFLLKS